MKSLILAVLIFLFDDCGYSQQQTKDFIDKYSTPVCFTIMYKDRTYLGNATGFFVKIKSTIYFITNNHVVGDKFYIAQYVQDHKKMPPNDSLPNSLHIRTAGKNLGEATSLPVKIKEKDGKKLWIDFYEDERDSTSQLDVVAIPIPKEFYDKIEDINLIELSINPQLALYPSGELFVIGFPLEYGYNNLYPLWKRGTIASDPNLINVGISKFLIDATTRQGMSGSPVVYRANSYTTYGKGYYAGNVFTFLVGIYNAQDITKELGVVIRLDKVFNKLNSL